jgi:riboflavin synthase alpha subunit
MFTGLVEDTGVVVAADRAAGASYGAPDAAWQGLDRGRGREPDGQLGRCRGLLGRVHPHPRDVTSLGDLAVGDRVNLEADILAKHVEKLVKP